jgi:predicted NBD/HSP70 family sugar kinase
MLKLFQTELKWGAVETSAARQANRSAVLARLLAASGPPGVTGADAVGGTVGGAGGGPSGGTVGGPLGSTSGGVTRAWLAEATGLSQATVSRVTDGLIAERLVAEGAAVPSGQRGRNAVSLHLTDAVGVVCGIDLGGGNCRRIVSDVRGRRLARAKDETPVHLDAAELAGWLAARVASLVAEAGHPGPLRAVAIGLPGMVTEDGLRIGGAPNVPQIEGTEFARGLREAIPVPVRLDNGANLALLGELRFGSGRGMSTVVMLTLGAGLGGGVAFDGRLLRGRHGMVGEFGYLPAGPAGELAEELLSSTGLLRHARTVADALRGKREQFDRALLLVLTAASAAYEPEAIVIGGELAPLIVDRLPGIAGRLRAALPTSPDLRIAELGDRSGALGAVAAACQAAFVQLGITDADITAATMEVTKCPER